MNNKKNGSILILGGGIAGMQAALDSANAGFKVYLLEKEPAIGGNMARLDKTFPTNDCAMCMISPKLVETGRHLNIEIIAYADLKKIEGEAGNFTVTINKQSRFIDEEKCNGCGDCEPVCPVTITDDFNGRLSKRKAIYRLYPQAIPNVFTIDKAAAAPPCRGTCPAGVNAQGYIALIGEGKYLNALDVVRERMPFAGICGRICNHPCEDKCNRAEIDEPVSVRNLKRFVADYERELIESVPPAALRERLRGERQGEAPPGPPVALRAVGLELPEKIAVIGAGPAGLTCAHDLAKMGYKVTVFEKEAKPGGMMRYGIPAYRLPRDFMDHEIQLLLDEGIQLETGKALGKDFTLDQLKADGFAATFVALGAQLPQKIDFPGSDGPGVLYGIPFLQEVNADKTPTLGKKVTVIGGGNVAMDVARCAVRMPVVEQVSLYCLEPRDKMPAHSWEIEEGQAEGISINPQWGLHQVIRKGQKIHALQLNRCTRAFDEDENFNPLFDEDDRLTVETDTVILAVGQECDLTPVAKTLETKSNRIAANPLTLQTSIEYVFAGGDIVLGPTSLVEAVAQGHRAAESIHRYLSGLDLKTNREPAPNTSDNKPHIPPTEDADPTETVSSSTFAPIPPHADRKPKPRQAMPMSEPRTRQTSFIEIDKGFTEEMAKKEAQRCLQCGICSQCRECVRVCKAEAIDHHMTDKTITLQVGAVIVSGGYDIFDPRVKGEYGLGRFPNVVTAMQFERILSASGPFDGHLRRISDNKVPQKIAWLQCVGSRDVTVGNDYCSAVCCMAATKEAIVAKEHEPIVQPTIFYIDIRTFGKGYETFQARAVCDYGVRYVRCQVSSIKENPQNHNLILKYIDQDNRMAVVEEEFHMVVLSAGIVKRPQMAQLFDTLALQPDPFGFLPGSNFNMLRSNRDGIFFCGAVGGPKDIPDTVMQSSAAAALCGELLHDARNSQIQFKEYPPEKPIQDQEQRIGVFVCHCGINIASVVEVEELTQYIATVPGVAHAQRFIYTCSQDSQEEIKRIINQKNLNRVIVASCTPRTHEGLFQETMQEAGLNKYLFEMADIREQCSWVHQQEPGRATDKAKALVRGSVGKAALLEALTLQKVPVTQAALIVGGGISGMTAALSLARQGFQVFLVEKSGELGGNLKKVHKSLQGDDWRSYLALTIQEIQNHPLITLFLETQLDSVSGFVGNFTSILKGSEENSKQKELKHGVILLATGADEYQPQNFLYGKHPQVVTQRQLEKTLSNTAQQNPETNNGSENTKHHTPPKAVHDGGPGGASPWSAGRPPGGPPEASHKFQTVVMVQCVGSRSADRPYCSRVCCGAAIKNAISLKEQSPETKVYILYRDINTYEFRELYYRRAREMGVMFIHFPDHNYPTVSPAPGKSKPLQIRVLDTVLMEQLTIDADLLVLSTAIEPHLKNNTSLSSLLKLSLDPQGFFMEAHVKLRPVDFANEGHFVCGLAHSPKYTEENIVQALAAAGRAATVLSKDYLQVGGVVSLVNADKCAVCLTCVRECIYNAPFINAEGKAEIEAAKCQGCGNCAAACPAKAIQLKTFSDEQQRALFQSILNDEDKN